MTPPHAPSASDRNNDPCPCGTGDALDQCCGRWHRAGTAPTAVQLMRARYSAYALGRMDFVHATWHPRTRPSRVELSADGTGEITWRRLVVEKVEGGGPFDSEGRVRFTAIGRSGRGRVVLEEDSRFVRENGTWFYVDGIVL